MKQKTIIIREKDGKQQKNKTFIKGHLPLEASLAIRKGGPQTTKKHKKGYDRKREKIKQIKDQL